METQAIDGLYTRLINLIKELHQKPNDQETIKQERIALHQLFFIFGAQMRKALMLLDQKGVSKYQCQIMKQQTPLMSVFKVHDADKTALVFISENGAKFCNCDDYTKNIVSDCDNIICHHILGAMLGEAYSEYSVIELNISQYLNLCSSCC